MWRGPVLRTDALFAVSLSSSDGENQNDHLHPAGPAAPCFFSTPCRKNGPNGERIMLESEYIGVAGAAGIWHAWAEAANAFRGRSASAVRIGNTQHREMTMIQRWGQKFPNRRSRRLRHVFFASVIFAFTPGRAHPQVLRWIDAKSLAIEGKGWADTKRYYDRLPRQAEGVVRQPVWDLSHDSAGMLIHFASDTPELQVRWTLTSAFLAAPNMSASGMSGLDLYVRFDGGWHWLAAVRPGASREGNAGVLFENIPVERREFLLYLPLCNGIESLQLGIPESRKLEPVVRSGEPLVFYGTSIVQGGCVMRPGMAYPAILGRRLDRAIINLGFSGNGRAEPEMASFLAELDPAAYVSLGLIVLVATFNIICTLIMIVMEKNKDIAILKSMGATSGSIMKIFVYQGVTIGAIGTLMGCIAGLAVALNLEKISVSIENLFGFKILPGDVYYLSQLPSQVNYSDVAIIVIGTMLICFLSTIYPSRRASNLDPAETLRYD